MCISVLTCLHVCVYASFMPIRTESENQLCLFSISFTFECGTRNLEDPELLEFVVRNWLFCSTGSDYIFNFDILVLVSDVVSMPQISVDINVPYLSDDDVY